jgi:hypothetical protein
VFTLKACLGQFGDFGRLGKRVDIGADGGICEVLLLRQQKNHGGTGISDLFETVVQVQAFKVVVGIAIWFGVCKRKGK